VQHARGQNRPALQRLSTLLALLPPSRWPLLHREVLLCQARLQLAARDLAAVQRWVADRAQDDAGLPLLQCEQEELLVARWHLAQGQADAAARLLNRWLSDAQAGGRTQSILEIQLLMALVQHTLDHAQAAQQLLQAVLVLTHVQGDVRLFLDEGESMRLQIAQRAHRTGNDESAHLLGHIDRLLTAFPLTVAPTTSQSTIYNLQSTMVEPLSPQEQRVLRLLAAGLSNPEIAQELIVSVNTVKTHLQRIYQKLNVTSRRAARDAAQHLKLL
jgi:LuxR family maltose regulon positive regulatory protein